jgi:hypothetical protein
MLPLDLPCSGKREPLLGSRISFHLWHCYAVYGL